MKMWQQKDAGIYIVHVEKTSLIDIFKYRSNIKAKVLIFALVLVLIGIVFLVMNIINIEIVKKKQEDNQKIILQQQAEEQARIESEEKRKKQEKLPILTEQGRQNIASIYRSETKRAFLTFDDGPSTVTTQILDVLKEKEVKATFFVLGSQVESMPEIVKRIYEEGHYIANHGYSHIYSSIYASPEAVLNEFNQCNEAVKKAIGVPEYNSHLFRFPGGYAGGIYADIKSQAKDLLNQNEILYVDWNVLTGDSETTRPTVEFEMKRLQETLQNKNSAVILMHDAKAKKVTADALPMIIDYLKEQGYEFENFYDIIK